MHRSVSVVGILCLALAATGAPRTAAAPRTSAAPARTAGAPAAVRPLAFEANAGQADARTRFVARGSDFRALLGDDGVAISADGSAPLRLRFAGARSTASPSGDGRLAGVVNYFVGSDPSAWRANVPTYERVRYPAVWPGVDAVFYGASGALEHDFVVAPGADPSAIALEVSGARRIDVAADGGLDLDRDGRAARLERPSVYQIVSGARRPVAARFVRRGGGRGGVEVGAYDPSLPLVVDPVLSFSTYVAGSADESPAGVTLDASGNVYVTGGTASLDFPTTVGAYSTMSAGSTDGFVTKLAPDGATLVYSTYFGGAGDDAVARAVVDASGNVTVCGGTGSTNFPTTAGAYRTTFVGGDFDGFVTRLNPTGSALVYSTYLGGSGDDGVAGVAVDASGNAYVTGGSTSSDYPTTAGAFDTNNSSFLGLPDVVVTKLNSTGSALVYSTFLGGSFNLEAGSAIAVDSAGNAYVGGATNGGFPTTSGAFDTSYDGGSFDGFVTKLNTTGTGLVYSTYLGGSGEDYVFGLAIDGSGNAYATGYVSSTNFPVVGAFQAANAGGFDAYVTKLNASGNALVYSSYLGGSGDEGLTSNLGTELQIAGGIAVDSAGSAYLTGFTDSTDFPVVSTWQPKLAGGFDAWVAKIAPNGASKTYASYLGGAAEERGLGIAADSAGSAYVVGFTYSANFPTTAGALRTANGGNALTDGFLTKIGSSPGDTAGIYIPATGAFFLRTSNSPGAANDVFTYGPAGAGWVPLAGDWDGNGTTTVGLYVPATGAFFLRNSDSPGAADLVFGYGPGGFGFVPLVGDWDGDGTDTIGLYDPATGAFFLRNSNTPGAADLLFTYGAGGAGLVPLAGDWNGDGVDTVGIYAPVAGAFFLRNANSPGNADIVFGYGPGGAGFVPLAGDWNADGTDTVGLYASSTGAWFLTNQNAPGAADVVFGYGPPEATPLVGHWGG